MKINLLFSFFLSAAVAANAAGYKDGIEYYKAGQYDNARTILERTLNDASTDKSLAYYYLGQTALAQNDKASAKSYFDKGLAENPECPYNYVGLGAIDLLNGSLSSAQDYFKTAQKYGKKNNEIIVAIARAYYNADPVKYEKEVDKMLAKAHKDSKHTEPAIYILEGDMLLDKKDVGGAAGKYEMATTYDEGNPEGYVKYANAYFYVNPMYSVSKLEELLAKQPNSALAQRELAEKYYESNQWTKAAEQYGKYIQNPNHFPEDKARYSVLLYAGENYDESLKVAGEVMAGDPSNFLMQRICMLDYAAKKDYNAAAAAAETFFANPNGKFTANDHMTYAEVLENMENDSTSIDKAIAQYDLAMNSNPNGDMLKTLSSSYTRVKEYQKAAEAYDGYISTLEKPSRNDYFMASGRWLNATAKATSDDQRLAAGEKGLEAINKAIEGAEPNPGLLQRKARIYIARNGNKPDQNAVDTYNEMIALLDKDAENKNPANSDNYLDAYSEAYQFIGYFYQLNGDKDNMGIIAEKYNEIKALIGGE